MKFGDKLALLVYVAALVAAMFLYGDGQAAKHYISNTGSDSNNGHTTGAPWLTTGHACSTVVAGDSVLFMGGTYSDDMSPFGDARTATMSMRASGTAGNPIVFKTAPGYGRATITAPTNGFGIIVPGESYIVFDSLIITNCQRGIWIADEGNYITVKNCKIYDTYLSDVPDNNCGNNGGGVLTFPNNDGGGPGKYIGIVVKSCTLYQNYDCDSNGISTSGVHLYDCLACTVDANVIFDQESGQGVLLKHMDSLCVVSNNFIYNCYKSIGDGGQNYGNKIFNNVIYHSLWVAIELRNSTVSGYDNRKSQVYNNTIYDTPLGILLFWKADELTENQIDSANLWNNIVVNAIYPTLYSNLINGNWDDNFVSHSAQFTNFWTDYNAYWNGATGNVAWWNGSARTLAQLRSSFNWDSSSVNVNPVFADTAGHDFHLTAGSPASVKTGGRGGAYLSYMGAYAPTEAETCVVSQAITKTDTNYTSIQLTDDLSGGVGSYDSVVIYFSATRANVANLSARDTLLTGVSDPKTWTKSGLAANTKYYFRFKAFDDTCHGDTTAIDSLTTLDYPTISQVITDTAFIDSVRLSDNLSGGAAPYDSLILYWSSTRTDVVNLVSGCRTKVASASDPRVFSKTSLLGNTKYYFRVSAYDTDAYSNTSAIDSVTTLPYATPNPLTSCSIDSVGAGLVCFNFVCPSQTADSIRIRYQIGTGYPSWTQGTARLHVYQSGESAKDTFNLSYIPTCILYVRSCVYRANATDTSSSTICMKTFTAGAATPVTKRLMIRK